MGENLFKSIKGDGKLISCVPPLWYSERYFKFMSKEVFIN